MIFDTHAHYDDEAFAEDRESLFDQMKEAGIDFVVNIGANMASSRETAVMCEKYPFLYGAVGVHPSDSLEINDDTLKELKELAGRNKIVAIGEIGLDYYWPEPSREVQKPALEAQITLAKEVNLPLVIHSREAAKDTADILSALRAGDCGGVIHCFSYGKEMARDFLNMGFYIGVGGVVTFKNAKKLKEAAQMDRVFFTNSGTEAIEGALKAARRYAYTKQNGRYEFIAMNHSFHGRSMGAVSVTGNAHYREPFEPLIGGVKFAEYNDLESVKALISEKTCAIILEPVQGEGGIYPAQESFLQGIRQLCDENDILLIFDEIQCGMGRCGTMFAWQGYGVKPDILTMAKAIGNGVPVGAFAMTEKVAVSSLVPGDHGTTYGGNPFVCTAVSTVLDIFEQEQLLAHVNEVAAYLEEKLDEIVENSEVVEARRGKGLMQGLVLTKPVGDVIKKCMKHGLIVISAGGNVLRLLPPLVITKKHVDEFIMKLQVAFMEE